MNKTISAVLTAAAVPALLALTSVADTVAFQPKEGATLTRTLTSRSQMTMDDMSMTMNGSPMPMPMEIDMEMQMEQTVRVADRYVEVAGGRPRVLRRTYESLEQQSRFTMGGMPDGSSQDHEVRGESDLEGKTVIFRWDEDEGAFRPRFPDDQGDAALLEGLEEDMDLRALLPEGPVSAGDTWQVEVRDLKALLMPGGNLKIEPTEKIEGAPGVGGDMGEMLGDMLEGEALAEYRGTREIDGVRVGVIHLTLKISSSNDMTDKIAEQMGEGPEGAEMEIDHVDVDLRMEGEGNLYWDLAAGLPHSYEMSGTVKMQMDMAMKMSMGGNAMNLGQLMQMSGTFNNGMTTR